MLSLRLLLSAVELLTVALSSVYMDSMPSRRVPKSHSANLVLELLFRNGVTAFGVFLHDFEGLVFSGFKETKDFFGINEGVCGEKGKSLATATDD